MSNKIATFLQVYKRPHYFQEQLRAIETQTVPSDKLWIIHNEGGKRFPYPEEANIIYAYPNQMFHLRFAVALLEDAEYIAIFDDDTVPGKRWYESCINTINSHNCLCVTMGITANLEKPEQIRTGWSHPNEEEKLVHFGGHAWFMRQEHLRFMWMDSIIRHDNGEDIMLSANLSIFGDIPTYVPPHPVGQEELWGSDVFEKSAARGSDRNAHWITHNSTHFKDRYALMRAYKEKGWKI